MSKNELHEWLMKLAEELTKKLAEQDEEITVEVAYEALRQTLTVGDVMEIQKQAA